MNFLKRIFIGNRRLLEIVLLTTCFNVLGLSEVSADALLHQPPDKIPAAISKAWDSTFMLFSASDSNYTVGGAFVVKVIRNHGLRTIYFISSSHLISNVCGSHAICYGLRLFQDMKAHGTAEDFNQIKKFSVGTSFDDVEIVKRDDTQDLILLKVSSSVKDSKIEIQPLDMEASCDLKKGSKVYTIGFPQTSVKPKDSLQPIMDQDFIRKRWNQGVYFTLVEMNHGKSPKLAGSTNMVLNGSSGSPLLSDHGSIVGMVEQGTATPQNHYQYTGNEDSKNYDWSATSVTCSDLKAFLRDAIRRPDVAH